MTADGGEYCGYDADDIPELDGIRSLSAAEELRNLLPKFFDDSPGGEKFMLYHDDLSTNNILIDSTTHYITGIVDWECVSLQPAWKVPRPPQLLYGPEINSQFCERNYVCTMPPIPPPHETLEKDSPASDLRASLEKALLRDVFNGHIDAKGQPEKLKRIFENKVAQVEATWPGVARWAKDVREGVDPIPRRDEDNSLYFWPED